MGRGIYTISIALMSLVPYVFGCTVLEYGARAQDTNHKDDSDDRKVYYSNIVVYGFPNETVTGDYPYKGVEGVYTIKFQVLCTYKNTDGPNIPSTIYIAGIGNEKGQIKGCPSAPIGDAKEAVMFLRRTDKPDVFETEFKPNVGESWTILDEISINCGLTLSKDSDEECDDYLPLTVEEECVQWTPIKIEKPVTPEPEPEEEPETEPKGENNDDTVVDINATEDGTDNQSDQGYKTNQGTDKNTGSVGGSTQDGNGSSSVVTTSLLVTLITVFITIVV